MIFQIVGVDEYILYTGQFVEYHKMLINDDVLKAIRKRAIRDVYIDCTLIDCKSIFSDKSASRQLVYLLK